MNVEFRGVLFLAGMFALLFANMFKDRNYKSEDENVDQVKIIFK